MTFSVCLIDQFLNSEFSNYIPCVETGNICFLGNEKVQTDQGKIRFDKLTTANTIFNKKIKKITRVINSEDSIICINKHALGKKNPTKNTYISRNHGIYLDSSFVETHNLVQETEPLNYSVPGKCMVRARNLLKLPNVSEIFRKKDPLYNVLQAKHGKMIVNGLVCETLHPYHRIAQNYFPNSAELNKFLHSKYGRGA